ANSHIEAKTDHRLGPEAHELDFALVKIPGEDVKSADREPGGDHLQPTNRIVAPLELPLTGVGFLWSGLGAGQILGAGADTQGQQREGRRQQAPNPAPNRAARRLHDALPPSGALCNLCVYAAMIKSLRTGLRCCDLRHLHALRTSMRNSASRGRWW